MECMRAQTRPKFTLSSKRDFGEWRNANSKGKNSSTEGLDRSRTRDTAHYAIYAVCGGQETIVYHKIHCPETSTWFWSGRHWVGHVAVESDVTLRVTCLLPSPQSRLQSQGIVREAVVVVRVEIVVVMA